MAMRAEILADLSMKDIRYGDLTSTSVGIFHIM